MLTPVVWMPLKNEEKEYSNNIFTPILNQLTHYEDKTYKAAPTTDSATERPIPTVAHM
jgi:hypothetical protein